MPLAPILLALLAPHPTPQVFAHVMPWFASKEVSGSWGWHWTMGSVNPDARDARGDRKVAAHDPPLLGPYDSSDPDVLECHTLWMRAAGIDGVVIDWYGTREFRDYAAIHRNTRRLIAAVRRAGLRYAICYEDQSAKHLRESGAAAEDAEASGREAIAWLEREAFPDPRYLRIGGRPALFVFGPQHFPRAFWTAAKGRATLLGLPHLSGEANFDGRFAWVPVHGGRRPTPREWKASLTGLFGRGEFALPTVPVAFPGFRDFYAEAGVHASYGFIDARGGRTLRESMDLARRAGAEVVQIATWNDHGEGTAIEPTRDAGYRSLETVQRTIAEWRSVKGDPRDLRLPERLYRLRKAKPDAEDLRRWLELAGERARKGDFRGAARALDAAKGGAERLPAPRR